MSDGDSAFKQEKHAAERVGAWWLANPSDEDTDYELPDRTVAGTLKTGEPTSWGLSTIGHLDPNDDDGWFQPAGSGLSEHRAIWGTDLHAKSFSLLDPYQTNHTSQQNNPFHGNDEWGFSSYVSGDCWVTPDDVIEGLSIPFDGLDDWVIDPATNANDYFPSGEEFKTFEVPERFSHNAQLGRAQVRLVVGSHGQADGRGFSMSRFVVFEIDDSIRLEQVLEKWVEPLSLFLSFVTGIPARLNTLQLMLPEHRWPLDLDYAMVRSQVVHNEGLGHFDYIAPLPQIAASGVTFDSLLQAFFELWEDDGNRSALRYFGVSQSGIPDDSCEARLFSAFQAVERYHRTNLDSRFSNRAGKGLRTQLQELQESAAQTSAALEVACPRMMKELARYRNRIAHGSGGTSNDFTIRCILAAKALRWMLRHVYFVKVGLSPDAVTQIIRDSHRFQSDIRLIEKHGHLFK